MAVSHELERKVDIIYFLRLIDEIQEKQIYLTTHTFSRLEEGERKVFKEQVIKEIIKYQIPKLVGIQKNGLYATFFDYGKKVLRIMIDIQLDKMNIITFYTVEPEEVPRI